MENEQSFWVSETLSHKVLPNQRVLVNVGSVGQPRDRLPQASWCICDTATMSLEIVRVNYDIQKTQERMRSLGFAEFLINRLAEGR
jgi:diadenosine tetraphosphatase ApaH/serine/threonine PP2A family protein phosphatase